MVTRTSVVSPRASVRVSQVRPASGAAAAPNCQCRRSHPPTRRLGRRGRLARWSPTRWLLAPAPQVTTNRNTEWLNQRAAWAFYVILILVCWLVVASFTDPGMAWTYVHLGHGVITYFLLHWNKGSPIQDDQGIYDK